jgi:hypothetical protein
MPALPPDRRGALPPAPGERGADGPAGAAGTGPVGPRCPRPAASQRPPSSARPAASQRPPTSPWRPGSSWLPAEPWPPGRPLPADEPLPADRPPLPGRPLLPRRSRLPTGPRPLPDPAAVRLCLIPDSAPPYDAEVTAARPPGAFPEPGSGPAAGGGAPRSSRPGGPGSPGLRKPPAPPRLPGPPPVSSGIGGPPAMSPDWPARFAQALAEALAGSRSPRQLVPWTTERARERIQRLGAQLSAAQQPRVRRVVTFHPTADAMEMAVVVGFGKRIHALAVRLERAGSGRPMSGRADQSGKWLCTTVEAA